MSKRVSSLFLAGSALLLLSPAFASDHKVYMGASCGFADNPLASHHRIHHRFTNTSGSSQWISCPIVRDQTGYDVQSLQMEIGGSATNVRFEMRNTDLGSLVGWNAEGTISLTGGNRFFWFSDTDGAAPGSGSFAFEAKLSNSSFVSHLAVWEESN
jgi:hypothetical protein